ncbi:MAG: hypothetical protein Q8M11_09570 [Sulfuritalea sp.]|nr:hypothetical protein [Sulfuritalea sp.]MDP1984033.1 hypothetical protein [Sulfuritalea sp.]
MKYVVIAAALVLSTFGVLAQGIAPLTGSVLFVTEFARDVSLGWSDKKTWSGYTPREVKWSRAADGVEVLAGTTASVLIDTKTYLHYPAAAGVSQLSETFSQSTTREGQSLEPGASWKAERTYASAPATWCHDNKNFLDSKFEVEPHEPYTLIIDGKETTLQVTPVVERGWWNRCYSGKRFTRLLVSKDIGAVVSIEHIGYTPQGQAHDSSYRLNVKEIKRQ